MDELHARGEYSASRCPPTTAAAISAAPSCSAIGGGGRGGGLFVLLPHCHQRRSRAAHALLVPDDRPVLRDGGDADADPISLNLPDLVHLLLGPPTVAPKDVQAVALLVSAAADFPSVDANAKSPDTCHVTSAASPRLVPRPSASTLTHAVAFGFCLWVGTGLPSRIAATAAASSPPPRSPADAASP
uniref:Uncharacterized protein n=1 Tax=Oryza meridionalis TaxID=40149 RepID=A0A0E0DNY0_9ORYZ